MSKTAYNIPRGDKMKNQNIDHDSQKSLIDSWHAHNTSEHIPNAETLEAFAETEEIIRKIRAGEYVKTYSSFQEILDEIDEEIANGDFD